MDEPSKTCCVPMVGYFRGFIEALGICNSIMVISACSSARPPVAMRERHTRPSSKAGSKVGASTPSAQNRLNNQSSFEFLAEASRSGL